MMLIRLQLWLICVMQLNRKEDNNDDGIYFYKSYIVVGISKEVDDNGNMIGAIEFESTKRFYIVVEFTHLVKEELR